MTHDWPTNLIKEEDKEKIYKLYPHNKEGIIEGTIGSFPGEFILRYLKPNYFICGHMHFYYSNIIDDTQVYAFDKCVGKRQYFGFIQVKKSIEEIDINDDDIYIEPEWMAITHAFNEYQPKEYDYYSFYKLFNNNAKTLYNELVLSKIKFNYFFRYKMEQTDIETNIDDLLKNIFTGRKKVNKEFDGQTKFLLSIFDIDIDDNNHFLSKLYLNQNE